MKKGIFITFEGIDGSGKSTQARFLKNYFNNKGLKAILTKEPGGTKLGEKIRNILLTENMNPVSEFLLFASDRKEHIEKIILPSLKKGKIVISDRFTDSSLAYQGYGRGVPLEFIKFVHNAILYNLEPDITFLIDVPPEIGLNRIPETDRIERAGLEFLHKIREGYLKMAKSDKRFFVINGAENKKLVWQNIMKFIEYWRKNNEK